MCEPVTIAAFAGLALTAAATVTKFSADRQQANAQAAANARAEQSARTNYNDNSYSEALSAQQEAELVSQRVIATNTDVAQKMATARVSAGEAGVTGLSIDSLMHDYLRQGDAANEFVKRQAQLDALQGIQRNKAYAASYQNTVNGQPLVNRPSFSSLAIGLGSDVASGVGNAARVRTVDGPDGQKAGDIYIPGISL